MKNHPLKKKRNCQKKFVAVADFYKCMIGERAARLPCYYYCCYYYYGA